MFRFDRQRLSPLSWWVVVFCTITVASIYPNFAVPVAKAMADTDFPEDQNIVVTVEVETGVYVAQPFEYKVRVLYKSEYVEPDLRKLVREIRIAPFEQLHLSRPTMLESDLVGNSREFILSYPVFGINVVPHAEYSLHPVTLSYRDIHTDGIRSITVQPEPVKIIGYYPKQIFGIPFQPLKGTVEDNTAEKQMAIIAGIIIFLIQGGVLIYGSVKPENILAEVEDLYKQYREIDPAAQSIRRTVLAFEKILLQLLLRFRDKNAYDFWTKQLHSDDPVWDDYLTDIKNTFRYGYSANKRDQPNVKSITESLDRIFEYIKEDMIAESQRHNDGMQETFVQRIAKRKMLFGSGVTISFLVLVLALLLANPSIWINTEVALYNGWVNRLPARMFDQTRDNEMNIIDVEMLRNMSEQQGVFEKLQSDILKSKYLYNYGTVVSKAYVASMMRSNVEEELADGSMGSMDEDETAAPPSFDFPVLLLSNAAKLYPYDEDTRRNLELAIMHRENEKKEDSGQQQGETGPPLPGFSRDLTPLLY